jgi:hypothetical protein
MADSFMIRFPFNGKPCYANVYVHGNISRKFYVHVVNPHLCPGLPAQMVFMSNDGKLGLDGTDGVPTDAIPEIVLEIEKNING